MRVFVWTVIICFLPLGFLNADTKIGDITSIDGLDENMIRGVGLVAG